MLFSTRIKTIILDTYGNYIKYVVLYDLISNEWTPIIVEEGPHA